MRAIVLALLILAGGPAFAQDDANPVVTPDPLDLPATPVSFCEASEVQNCGCDAERGMCLDCGDLEAEEGVIEGLSREATVNACLQLQGEIVADQCRY